MRKARALPANRAKRLSRTNRELAHNGLCLALTGDHLSLLTHSRTRPRQNVGYRFNPGRECSPINHHNPLGDTPWTFTRLSTRWPTS